MLGIRVGSDARDTKKYRELTIEAVASPFPEQPPEIILQYDRRLRKQQTSRAYRLAQRGLDIAGALIGLALMALLLPIIALLVWIEDRGPIFYTHVRVGQYNRPFVMYKFRSMAVDSDAYLACHPELMDAWKKSGKLANDPRVTRVGRLLRRTSLDELPQALNILRGEMSLVGPRAIQPSEVEQFGQLIALRQLVKPGLTGLWQVSGRSMTDYEQRAILDCTYVVERSFWMDMRIILKTIPVVLFGTGAY